VPENKVHRRIFRPNKNDIAEQFMILHDEKTSDLYRSHSFIVRIVKCR